MGRIDNGQVAHATKVEKPHRRHRAQTLRQRPVVDRGKRRALPAHRHVIAAKIPDHLPPRHGRQHRTVPGLVGAGGVRIMG